MKLTASEAKGLKIADILAMDIGDIRAQTPAVKKIIGGKIRDVANKRYRRAIAADELAPAISSMTRQGGAISLKGRSGKDLNREIQRGYYFLTSKTSGAVKRAEYLEAVQERLGTELTRDQEKTMWKAADRLHSLWQLDSEGKLAAYGSLGTDRIQRVLARLAKKYKKVDTIIRHSYEEIEKEYQRQIGTLKRGRPRKS